MGRRAETKPEAIVEPEVTENAEATVAPVEPEVTEETKPEASKVYKFTSVNKWLTCASLKVQFINGIATTPYLEVAKALAKIEGVELVEE